MRAAALGMPSLASSSSLVQITNINMVVPVSTEFARALTTPLDVIQDVFVKHGQDESFPRFVNDHFAALFDSEELRGKVPFLTSKQLDAAASEGEPTSSKLVRWRCMIQDTSMGNEVLPRAFRTQDGRTSNGLFGAAFRARDGAAPSAVVEAGEQFGSITTLCGVSLPGQTAWARQKDEGDMRAADADEASTLSSSSLADKVPREGGVAVLLKVYDEQLAESLQVTQIVDVLGILDQSTLPSADWTQMGSGDVGEVGEEAKMHASLHVLSLSIPEQVKARRRHTTDAATSRRMILNLLAEKALGGDALAAQWTFLALVARIHTRAAVHSLGSLSLNISNFPSSSSSSATHSQSSLFETIAALVPLVADQSLNLSHLNAPSTRFLPKSDADERGLRAGRLQLARGTILFIDERTMEEGQLKDNGIANVRALSDVLSTHKLAYAFPFSSHEMDVDMPCLIISQGKSFLPCDVHVPLRTKADASALDARHGGDSTTTALTQEEWTSVREYIDDVQQKASQSSVFAIPADVSERIQDDFVTLRKARQSAPSNAASNDVLGTPTAEVPFMETQDDLNRVIQVARLLCLADGRDTLQWDDWQAAKQLDQDRLARL